MSRMNMIQAIRSAHDVMLEKDPTVVAFGQDIGYFGGVFRCTEGLQEKYGDHRVIDAPIAEGGIVGTAIGLGINGLRPVVEIQFADYIYPGFDQIVSELSRLRYRSAGDFFSPVTIRTRTFLLTVTRHPCPILRCSGAISTFAFIAARSSLTSCCHATTSSHSARVGATSGATW